VFGPVWMGVWVGGGRHDSWLIMVDNRGYLMRYKFRRKMLVVLEI